MVLKTDPFHDYSRVMRVRLGLDDDGARPSIVESNSRDDIIKQKSFIQLAQSSNEQVHFPGPSTPISLRNNISITIHFPQDDKDEKAIESSRNLALQLFDIDMETPKKKRDSIRFKPPVQILGKFDTPVAKSKKENKTKAAKKDKEGKKKKSRTNHKVKSK